VEVHDGDDVLCVLDMFYRYIFNNKDGASSSERERESRWSGKLTGGLFFVLLKAGRARREADGCIILVNI